MLLMGENGAGKSTRSRFSPVWRSLKQERSRSMAVTIGSSTAVPRRPRAMVSVPCIRSKPLCPNLTVAENLFIGREPRKAGPID